MPLLFVWLIGFRSGRFGAILCSLISRLLPSQLPRDPAGEPPR